MSEIESATTRWRRIGTDLPRCRSASCSTADSSTTLSIAQATHRCIGTRVNISYAQSRLGAYPHAYTLAPRAARRSHYEAVHTLLEAHVPCAEQNTLDLILKTVRTKNHRGKTPYQVAKNECIRRLIQAFDDGRLPLFRHPRTLAGAAVSGSHRRMTDFTQQRRPSSRVLDPKGATVARTHSLKNMLSSNASNGHESYHAPEDEFGIIDVFTPRAAEPHHMRRSSSSRSFAKPEAS